MEDDRSSYSVAVFYCLMKRFLAKALVKKGLYYVALYLAVLSYFFYDGFSRKGNFEAALLEIRVGIVVPVGFTALFILIAAYAKLGDAIHGYLSSKSIKLKAWVDRSFFKPISAGLKFLYFSLAILAYGVWFLIGVPLILFAAYQTGTQLFELLKTIPL